MRPLRELYQGLPVIRELKAICSAQRDAEARSQRRWDALNLALRQLAGIQCATFRDHLLCSPRYAGPRNLTRHGHQLFSQNEEDGIIAEILRRLGLDGGVFVEIGVGDGLENNTTALLVRGWSGYWIEGDEPSCRAIRQQFRDPVHDGRLVLRQAFVDAGNVAHILAEAGAPPEPDLLSLDIDRNTYWVWAALSHMRPKVIVVEYNGHFPADVEWRIPYNPTRLWDGGSSFGASLKAYEGLGRQLGYSLVGCTLNGTNAFLVRSDLCGDLFEEPFTAEHHYEPLRPFLLLRLGFPPRFDDQA